jgi:photosystem I subunit X
LFTSPLFAVAIRAADWDPKIAIIMVVCNVIAIAFGKATIKHQNVGLGLPGNFFGGMGHGAMLGVTCFGHILGAGVILGLTNMGVL